MKGKVQLMSPRLFVKNESSSYSSLAFADRVGTIENGMKLFAYRALSYTDVAKGTVKSLTFENEAVLKSTVDEFKRLPLFVDHKRHNARENIGMVIDAQYSEAATRKVIRQGKVIELNMPAGIDVLVGVYTEEAKLIKAIELGAVPACSATFAYKYKRSHTSLSGAEFMANLGQVVDGKEVRPIITDIIAYDELSLLRRGADTYALRYAMDEEEEGALSLSAEDVEDGAAPLFIHSIDGDLAVLTKSDTHIISDNKKSMEVKFESLSFGGGDNFAVNDELKDVIKDGNVLSLGEEQYVVVSAAKLEQAAEILTARTNQTLNERRAELKEALAEMEVQDESLVSLCSVGSLVEIEIAMTALGHKAKKALMPICTKCASGDHVQYSRTKGSVSTTHAEDDSQDQTSLSESEGELANRISERKRELQEKLNATMFTSIK